MTYWVPEPVWQGRTVAILASGPSMSAAVAASQAHLPRIAINRTYELAPDADVIYGGDVMFWHKHPEALALPGVKCCIAHSNGAYPNTPPGVVWLRYDMKRGLSDRPGWICAGGSSGYQAIQIAVQMGAARILLHGFDCKPDASGSPHWHGPHRVGLGNPQKATYEGWIAAFKGLAPLLAARGVEVINCTPDSALRCFRMSEEVRAA